MNTEPIYEDLRPWAADEIEQLVAAYIYEGETDQMAGLKAGCPRTKVKPICARLRRRRDTDHWDLEPGEPVLVRGFGTTSRGIVVRRFAADQDEKFLSLIRVEQANPGEWYWVETPGGMSAFLRTTLSPLAVSEETHA